MRYQIEDQLRSMRDGAPTYTDLEEAREVRDAGYPRSDILVWVEDLNEWWCLSQIEEEWEEGSRFLMFPSPLKGTFLLVSIAKLLQRDP